MKKIIILTLSVLSQMVNGQDTIRVGHQFKAFAQLEMGTTKDLIYTEVQGNAVSLTLKTRTTEMVEINGRKLVKITHAWQSPGTEHSGNFVYWCEPGTLKPLQHIRTTQKLGKEGFLFKEGRITALDSVKNNAVKALDLDLSEPTFNWEVDLETYSLLPMKNGYHAVMNFYHPGGSTPPAFYHLKVTGSEKLILPNGKPMDCWILFTDYGGTQPTQFWYTKKEQNFVKMEGTYKRLSIRKERLY